MAGETDADFAGAGGKSGGNVVCRVKYQGQFAGPEPLHKALGLLGNVFDKGWQDVWRVNQDEDGVVC